MSTGRVTGLVSTVGFWIFLLSISLAGHFLIAEPGTFPGWDESVFFSQSGDIVGVDSEPSSYAASREPGTPLLIASLRALGLNMESMRLAFLAVYVSLVAFGFFLLSPMLGWGSVAGFAVMVGHWISLAYSARFFGVPIAAALFVVAVACAARLTSEPTEQRRWLWASGLVLSVVGMLAMRHLEAPLAATLLFMMIGLISIGRPRRLAMVIGAGIAALAVFAGVEIMRASYYHGSFGAWVDALNSQLGGVPLTSDGQVERLLKVAGSLGGGYHLWIGERIPTPSWIGTGIAVVGVWSVVLLATVRARRDQFKSRNDPARFVLWVGLVVTCAYFALFTVGRYPSSPKDRYLMWIVASSALLVAALLRHRMTKRHVVALLSALGLFIAGGVAAAQHDISNLLNNGEGLRQIGLTMHVLAGGESCEARARYGAPALQLASGCQVRSVTDLESAEEWLREPSDGSIRFLVFPAASELEAIPGWAIASRLGGSVNLWYLPTTP